MKKVLALVFSVSMAISVIVIGNVSASALSFGASSQIDYLKRKTKKVYRRTKSGTKDIAHDTKHKTKRTYYKTKSGTKDLAHDTKHKTKRVTKKTYRKTKDKVTD
jgi:hypothetical protein